MIWLALLVAVLVAVATAAAVLGRVDGSLADATTTMSHVPLPADPLTPGDLDGLRFDTALRGYRMSQVDVVVDRLRREIADLQTELERATGTRTDAYHRPVEPAELPEPAEGHAPAERSEPAAAPPSTTPERA